MLSNLGSLRMARFPVLLQPLALLVALACSLSQPVPFITFFPYHTRHLCRTFLPMWQSCRQDRLLAYRHSDTQLEVTSTSTWARKVTSIRVSHPSELYYIPHIRGCKDFLGKSRPTQEVTLPREAVLWTISEVCAPTGWPVHLRWGFPCWDPPVEVDVFLGSLGFIRPGRESSMMRSSKRLGNEREVSLCFLCHVFETALLRKTTFNFSDLWQEDKSDKSSYSKS